MRSIRARRIKVPVSVSPRSFSSFVNSAEGGSLIGGQVNGGLQEVQGVAWTDKGSVA